MNTRRSTLQHFVLALAMACLPGAASLAQDKTPAIDGYDPVAYFTEKRPVQGKSTISYNWDDRRYLFSNAKNRDLFAANPDRYEPQFGGLCAAGVSHSKKLKADPTIWRIVDGKLYVFSRDQGTEEAFGKSVAVANTKWKDVK
jgi:YHS domain-containing protein